MSMIAPKLEMIRNSQNSHISRALVYIPGFKSSKKINYNEKLQAILNSAWEGAIYYLWWDSKNAKLKWSHANHHAKKTARKYLPKILSEELQGMEITLVAHSLGTYLVYQYQKKFNEYSEKYAICKPTIKDVVFLGGSLQRHKDNWNPEFCEILFNLYSRKDKVFKGPGNLKRHLQNLARGRRLKAPCGVKPIKTQHCPYVTNVDVTELVGKKHNKYLEAFTMEILVFENGRIKIQ